MLRKVLLVLVILVVGVVPAQARDGDERRGGHKRSEQRVERFHHVGGYFLPYSYYPYPDYTYFYPSPVYSPPAVVEQLPPVSQQSPVQREVMFPNGKYVLDGDGVMDAYHWVWIPTVPEMPPAPPAAPPAAPVASQPFPADSTLSRPPQQLYRWVDAEGVANWTNNWEAVPMKYRRQAKRSL
jgi:hypothetical protein